MCILLYTWHYNAIQYSTSYMYTWTIRWMKPGNSQLVPLSISADVVLTEAYLLQASSEALNEVLKLNGVYIDYPNTAYSSKSCKTFFLVRDTFCFRMWQSQTIVKHGQSHYDHRSLLEVFFQVHTPQFDCMCVNLCHLINFPSAM